MCYLVTRHKAAKDWIEKKANLKIDKHITQFNISILNPGDSVIGTLPIHHIADITEKNCHFYNLTIEVVENMRGKEFSYNDMENMNARIEKFTAKKLPLAK